jgi:hypothetical protein
MALDFLANREVTRHIDGVAHFVDNGYAHNTWSAVISDLVKEGKVIRVDKRNVRLA